MRRIISLLFFTLFVVGCVFQPTTEPRRPDPDSEPTIVPTAIAIEKPTYLVENGSVTAELFSSGRITPVDQNQLSFPRAGQIETLLVGKDAVVNAGDIVATLDTAALEQSLSQAEVDLTLAQERLADADENLAADRRRAEINVELIQLQLDFAIEEAGDVPTAEQLLAINVLRLQLELAELDLADFDDDSDPILVNQVAQAERHLASLEMQIAQSTLIAPISGTVMVLNVTEGDTVAPDETVLVVADLTQVEAQVSLLDRELELLSEGMEAFAVLPSRPDVRVPMTVRQLPFPYGTGPESDESSSIVRLGFDGSVDTNFFSIGTRVEVTILLEQRDDVLWLPPAAIREFNGRLFVVVQEGQTQRRLDIRVGLQNENQIEIVSGVSEGQVVVGP